MAVIALEYIIDSSNNKGLNWAVKGAERVIQNIINLMNTFKYEVAYDRTLGVTGKYIDMPLQNAIAQSTSEIISLISEREPRAKIKNIKYTGLDIDGNMQFRVVIDIG
jgi:phage baseplate assembly protein W